LTQLGCPAGTAHCRDSARLLLAMPRGSDGGVNYARRAEESDDCVDGAIAVDRIPPRAAPVQLERERGAHQGRVLHLLLPVRGRIEILRSRDAFRFGGVHHDPRMHDALGRIASDRVADDRWKA